MKMLEKAARALLKQRQPWQRTPFEDAPPDIQAAYCGDATAVLRSLREPDDGVIEATREVVMESCKCDAACADHGTPCGCGLLARRVWQAGIDKALEPPQ